MVKQSNASRLVLIDGHALIFRAFYALPIMTSPAGEFTNAVYGFTRILLNVMDELEPDCLAIAFDSPGGTFRNQQYPDYKAHRPEPPSELIPQISLTQKVVETFNVPMFAMPGWEADDIIASLAHQAVTQQSGAIAKQVTIVTGDLDLLQLVDDKHQINVYVPGLKGKVSTLYSEQAVVEKLGISRDLVPDYKGLAGDASDNIPGIKGIGPKTAVKLLVQFSSIEGIYQHLEANPETAAIPKAVRNKLSTNKEIALLSKQLATISDQAPVTLDLGQCLINKYNKEDMVELFRQLGFKSLLPRLPDDEFELGVQEALF